MRNFISKNFFSLIIILLLIIVFVQRSGYKPDKYLAPIVKIDTIFVVKDSVVFARPQLLEGRRDTFYEATIQYLPSQDYAELVVQFKELREQLLTENTFSDTLKIDSIGYVAIKDQVQKNTITNRKYSYNLKYPEVTKTITLTSPYSRKRQLYVGGGIGGDKVNIVNSAEAGFMYKDRKDRLFGVGVQKQFNASPITYEVKTFWKINLKK